MKTAFCVVAALIGLIPGALAQQPVHGLWVWKTPTLLDLPSRGESLRDFCRSEIPNGTLEAREFTYPSPRGLAPPS